MEDILELIFKRRSIRIYDRKKLDKETITKLMQAAMAAPSGSNSRPWEFVVVTDEEALDKMRSKLKYGNYNAPAAVVVCGNIAIAQNESATRYWVQDCSAATQNLLLPPLVWAPAGWLLTPRKMSWLCCAVFWIFRKRFSH